MLRDEVPDAVIATTPAGEVMHWNKAAQNIFGYSASEAIGQVLEELVVPAEYVEEERRILHEAIEKGSATYESIRKRKDGSLVYVDISSKAIRAPNGNIRFVLCSKKDVSHLKVLRDAKLVEARFRNLIESVPDAIVIINPTGRIVLANTQAEKLFGYGRGELVAQLVELLLPDRFRGGHVGHRTTRMT